MTANASEKSPQTWHAVTVAIESRGQEAVEYALIEAGALGTVFNEPADSFHSVTGYFNAVPDLHQIQVQLDESLRIHQLPASVVKGTQTTDVPDQDWLAEWKESWQPVEVGERFIVAPPWSNIPDISGRLVIRIEPGMAFGTGTHETTRLCLRAIEKYFRGGSFLDVGTGTGILAIAAAKLFPSARVEACDTDDEAVLIARENARLNGVAERIAFKTGSVDSRTASADLVCANLTAPVIVELLSELRDATCGRLVLSGILEDQLGVVQTQLARFGVTELDIQREGEWISIVA